MRRLKRLGSALFLLSLPFVHEKALSLSVGVTFGAASQFAHALSVVLSPWSCMFGNECLLFSQLSVSAAEHIFNQGLKRTDPPSSLDSWKINQALLSQIPAATNEMKQLLHFLERRWLAKANGFYSAEVDLVCPTFGLSVQVHPESTNSYARDPGTKPSRTYLNRVETWKQSLPYPPSYPLILTRPVDLGDYLSSSQMEVIDLTSYFPEDKEKWMDIWGQLRKSLLKKWEKNLDQIICIQRLSEGEMGAIQILPLDEQVTGSQYQYLLDWISCFGFSANPIELDRFPHPVNEGSVPVKNPREFPYLDQVVTASLTKESFLGHLHSFLQNQEKIPKQPNEKTLMVFGVLRTILGLLDLVAYEKWEEVFECPTRSAVVKLSFSQIEKQLDLLSSEENTASFYQIASHVEQIHANLVALLEIFSPYDFDDFPSIYSKHLISLPASLHPLIQCTVHPSAMTSVAGILHAAKPQKVMVGENTYFECLDALQYQGIKNATEKDWDEVTLIFAQFNPVLKRGKDQIDAYHAEDVSCVVKKAIREGKALTLALDSTLDYINSPKVAALLEEFKEEIEKGLLNFICFRSGLKFDLFGMDNFAGAPFYMIHNKDPKWKIFDSLIDDPRLKTDRLSLNWFCLAYEYGASFLEQYRTQVFTNTRLLLNSIPTRLLSASTKPYRVIPVEANADPAFIDIKVTGLFHKIRAALLVGGCLYLKSLEAGHPIFYRRSLGFYHPNFGIIFDENYTTIRLTLGLDPEQVKLFAHCFEMIDRLY